MTLGIENTLKEKIQERTGEALRAILLLKEERNVKFIENVAFQIASVFQSGGKVIIAGNGGSLCDAAHFAEELTGFFHTKRKALPCLVLSEPGYMTCAANDIGYEWVFARGVEAFGTDKDLFIGISTSGNSQNIIRAFEAAKKLGLITVAFLGKDGGKLRGVADFEQIIPGFPRSDRVQEVQMTALHIIVELIEDILFEKALC